mgnify:CR=1 FL=1
MRCAGRSERLVAGDHAVSVNDDGDLLLREVVGEGRWPVRVRKGMRILPLRLFQKLLRKSSGESPLNHRKVFGEAFFKKLQKTPPFLEKDGTQKLFVFCQRFIVKCSLILVEAKA